jgi:biopolymer transport protein ExbD
MKRRRIMEERERPRLEIVPMIDIMMFLLVFFVMIVLRMIPDSGVTLTLPSASTAADLKPTQIVVMIGKNNDIHIKNTMVTRQGLETYLQELVAAKKKVNVIIAGDKGIKYDRLMQVMNAVRKAGVVDVGLATKT